MVAYALYWLDETDRTHFIGLLPERRKNPERVTHTSISDFVRTILGNRPDVNHILSFRVTLDERTGEINWPKPYLGVREAG
jgi:hypothetical protein